MEEEISLRELIEILIRGKWLIAAITIAALLIGGVASFFVMKPIYEAKATMMVTQPSNDDSLQAYLRTVSGNDAMSLETYKSQIKNPVLLDRVRTKLELDPDKYTIRGLSSLITVNVLDKTNLIELKITHTDPKFAAAVVNTLAEEFVKFINDEGKKQIVKTISILEEQVAAEQQKMDAALDEYTAFLSQSQGIAHVEKAYQAKLELLTNLQISLAETKISLETTRAGLAQGEQVLAGLSPVIGTEKTLMEDDLMREYIKGELNGDLSKLASIRLENQEVNEAYISLLAQVNTDKIEVTQLEKKLVSLEETIAKTAAEVEKLQIELAEKKAVEERLVNNLARAKSNYNRFIAKHEDALIAGSLDSADAQINLVAPAWVPVSPVGPRKMLNLAIAGVLGLMLGVFVAFFRDYWNNSGSPTASV